MAGFTLEPPPPGFKLEPPPAKALRKGDPGYNRAMVSGTGAEGLAQSGDIARAKGIQMEGMETIVEQLPMVGAVVGTALLPEIAIPAAIARWGPAIPKVGSAVNWFFKTQFGRGLAAGAARAPAATLGGAVGGFEREVGYGAIGSEKAAPSFGMAMKRGLAAGPEMGAWEIGGGGIVGAAQSAMGAGGRGLAWLAKVSPGGRAIEKVAGIEGEFAKKASLREALGKSEIEAAEQAAITKSGKMEADAARLNEKRALAEQKAQGAFDAEKASIEAEAERKARAEHIEATVHDTAVKIGPLDDRAAAATQAEGVHVVARANILQKIEDLYGGLFDFTKKVPIKETVIGDGVVGKFRLGVKSEMDKIIRDEYGVFRPWLRISDREREMVDAIMKPPGPGITFDLVHDALAGVKLLEASRLVKEGVAVKAGIPEGATVPEALLGGKLDPHVAEAVKKRMAALEMQFKAVEDFKHAQTIDQFIAGRTEISRSLWAEGEEAPTRATKAILNAYLKETDVVINNWFLANGGRAGVKRAEFVKKFYGHAQDILESSLYAKFEGQITRGNVQPLADYITTSPKSWDALNGMLTKAKRRDVLPEVRRQFIDRLLHKGDKLDLIGFTQRAGEYAPVLEKMFRDPAQRELVARVSNMSNQMRSLAKEASTVDGMVKLAKLEAVITLQAEESMARQVAESRAGETVKEGLATRKSAIADKTDIALATLLASKEKQLAAARAGATASAGMYAAHRVPGMLGHTFAGGLAGAALGGGSGAGAMVGAAGAIGSIYAIEALNVLAPKILKIAENPQLYAKWTRVMHDMYKGDPKWTVQAVRVLVAATGTAKGYAMYSDGKVEEKAARAQK